MANIRNKRAEAAVEQNAARSHGRSYSGLFSRRDQDDGRRSIFSKTANIDEESGKFKDDTAAGRRLNVKQFIKKLEAELETKAALAKDRGERFNAVDATADLTTKLQDIENTQVGLGDKEAGRKTRTTTERNAAEKSNIDLGQYKETYPLQQERLRNQEMIGLGSDKTMNDAQVLAAQIAAKSSGLKPITEAGSVLFDPNGVKSLFAGGGANKIGASFNPKSGEYTGEHQTMIPPKEYPRVDLSRYNTEPPVQTTGPAVPTPPPATSPIMAPPIATPPKPMMQTLPPVGSPINSTPLSLSQPVLPSTPQQLLSPDTYKASRDELMKKLLDRIGQGLLNQQNRF